MDVTSLAIIQIILSITLIGSVLTQKSGAGIGSLFGGPSSLGGGEFYRSRRGAEKYLFYFTILNGFFLVLTCFLYFYI